uniref:MSP domain-containing protein n=1 Tax=Panagrolaimus sp. PS1159 TaxID=55785 RepID=A0AC35FV02_9BILA
MGSPSNWYTKFLSTRCVPPLFYGETGSSSDCYALTIKLAEFRELPTGENYRIKMCFFDTQYKVFFGRQFTSKLLIGNENKIIIDETIFFHSPIKEERIVVVIEIIEFDHKSEFGTLQARNSIKLTKLIADPGIAVVFALDYLIGVKQNLDTVTDSHLIMLCWGAWCPYIDESFTISDTITVPLIGGPRPNPDEILCFKNLLRLRQKENDPFNDGKPRISLKFNFAMVGSTDPQVLQKIPPRLDNFLHVPERTISNLTPSPKPDIPVPKGVLEDIGNSEIIRHNPFDQARITVVDVKKEYEAAELVPSQTRAYQKPRYGLESERTALDLEAVPDMYLTKPTTFTRQINNYISSIQFPQILDRNGSAPTFVDPSGNQPLSLETELKDRLEMNEIIIQFIAILPLKNSYITSNSRISRYFFTLQFYRFQTVTTERLVAHPGIEWKSSLPIILKRIDENNKVLEQNGNGFMIKFLVDKYSITNETDFFNYLNNYSLSIDVWNADSFVHVGTSRIPLKFLCRQSSEAVQTNLQCPIVQSSLPQEEAVTAFLYLKMANIGHPLNPQIDAFQSKNTSAIVSHRMRRLGESQFNSLKIRARPLGAIHESTLQRFLTAQKLDIHQRKEELFGNDSLERLKKWSDLKIKNNNNNGVTKANLKRFVFQEELEAYKLVRNESKAAKLLKAVFAAITVSHSIHTQNGQVEFFEFCLQNTFAQNIKCFIDISDARIKPITNVEEWKHFKTLKNLKTPLEKDLFEIENHEKVFVRLSPMESVYLPFKFDPKISGGVFKDEEEIVGTKIIFKHFQTNEPISILDLSILISTCPISAQFRWFIEECSKVAKLITIPNYDHRIASVQCSDASVLLQLRNNQNGTQDLYFTCHSPTSPSIKYITVLLFGDKFHSSLAAVWKIFIHSMQKLYVEGIQAQTTKIPLSLKPSEQTDQLIQFHTTSEAISLIPHQPFIASPTTLSQIKAFLVPNFTGKRNIIVTAVDVNIAQLINCWLMFVTVSPPNIVKTYEISLPLQMSQNVQKKIAITNQYSQPRNYRIHTSNANLVTVEKEYNSFQPNETISVTLEFHPIQVERDFVVEVLVFVEDADLAQQEEAYSLRITYSQT